MLNVNALDFSWDLTSWIMPAIIGLITFYLVRFYLSLKDYPPGPIPFPLVGNILMLKGSNKSPFESFADMQKKYGDVFTFWMGNWPLVFIFDLNLAKEAFNKEVFSGRPQLQLAKIMNGDGNDIIFSSFGAAWEVLRKIGHSAVRKFSISERLPVLTSDVVDEIMAKLIKESEEKAFDPKIYLKTIMDQTMASIAYGKKCTENELKFLNKIDSEVIQYSIKAMIADFLPIMRFPLANALKRLREINSKVRKFIMEKLMQHQADYQHGIIRDFADALLASREEAIKEEHENIKYLNDENLLLTLLDLFTAGSETTYLTLSWSLLLMANFPGVQIKLRGEISSQIGDRIPVQNDKNNCHYVCAFINEVLRFRNVAPMGIFRSVTSDTQIGEHRIAKDALVFVHQGFIMNDSKYWTKPEMFNPDRFLDSKGKLLANKNAAFIPFGIGRRNCPGEKLAMADLFLIIVRILQQTEGYLFTLPNGASSGDLESDPLEKPVVSSPKNYQLILKKV